MVMGMSLAKDAGAQKESVNSAAAKMRVLMS
jgi:hypothetical protein